MRHFAVVRLGQATKTIWLIDDEPTPSRAAAPLRRAWSRTVRRLYRRQTRLVDSSAIVVSPDRMAAIVAQFRGTWQRSPRAGLDALIDSYVREESSIERGWRSASTATISWCGTG